MGYYGDEKERRRRVGQFYCWKSRKNISKQSALLLTGKTSQNSQHYCSLEKHWHPAGLEFIRIYRALGLPPLAFQLYLYMLIRSSPVDSPRVKNAHLHGDTIQKGEFFENKASVADFFGKSELEEKAKINWFMRTVKPLVQQGLVKKIESGKRGFNATYIVYDVRNMTIL